MDVSMAQPADLTCPECERTFSADVWLIVDAAARPDLLEQIRAGALHDLPCPHCGHGGAVDVPLLLYRPGEEPTLLFSPARTTSGEQDREQAQALVGALQERLGDRWRDEWLSEGLTGVPRDLLPTALKEGVETALEQAAAQMEQQVERLREEDPEAYRQLEQAAQLLPTLQAFLDADNWADSRRVLEQHPELLGDEADALLGQMIAAQDDEDAIAYLEQHRELLRRCRQVGVEQAFADLESGDADPEAALRALMERAESDSEARATLEEMERQMEQHSLMQAIDALIEAESPAEVLEAVQEHPALLTDEADAMLRQGIENARQMGQAGMARHIEERYQILRQIREQGLDQQQLAALTAA
jgi:hypothetical protein